MANSNIKGITIEIDGDTVGLQNALRDVNNRTKDLQSELKDVQRALKFDPNNVELLAQRQQLLTQQVAATTEKLNSLKDAQAQVQAQFERGDIGEEAYRAFRRELLQTEQTLQGYQTAIQDMNDEQQKVAEGTRRITTLFEATGSSVEDYADIIGQRLVRAIQNGTATSRDLEYAFQRIGRQAIGANGDIDHLRTALMSVDDGNSVTNVRREISRISTEAEDAQGSVKELGGELTNMVAGLAAGGGIAGVIEQALDVSTLNTKIDISFDVPKESVQSVKNAINSVSVYGIDAEDALEGVRKQWVLNKDASDETNAAVVKGAGAIAASYADIDFGELIQETNEVAKTFGISNQEALGLVHTLLKTGFPPDQIDTIAEYGDQLKQAGFNAEQIQAIMSAGVDTKSWNIDNLLDGVKEGRIQLANFGSGLDKSMKAIISQTDISADKFVKWGQDIAGGGEAGQKAMFEAAKALAGVEDATVRNQLGTKMFGTMWEDQGTKIVDTITKANDKQVDLKKGMDDLNASTKALDSTPAVELQTALTDMKTALTPLLTKVAELVGKVAEWVSANPELAATITAIATAIGILVGIAMAVAPIITAITGAMVAFEVGAAPVILIILAIIAAIAALIAIGILLYKNWDDIKAKTIEVWGAIKDWLSSTWESIKSTASTVWDSITDFFKKWGPTILTALTGPIGQIVKFLATNWSNIKTTASTLWGNIKTAIVEKAQDILSSVQTKFESIKSAIQDPIKKAVSFVSEQIEKIKGFFSNLKLSLPKIKLPHFSLSGNFSLMPPSVPKLAVDWYKNGGVFAPNSPQLIGIGDANVPEAALPLSDKVLGTIANMISDRMDTGNGGVVVQQMIVREEADIQKIARELYKLSKSTGRGKGVLYT